MKFPFFTRQQPQPAAMETRANYSDAVLDAVLSHVSSPSPRASATAAAETAIGLIARSFAASVVTPVFLQQTLTSGFLASVGRDLSISGNSVWLVDVGDAGEFQFQPCFDWDIAGKSLDSARWSYAVKMGSPSGDVERRAPAGRVLHIRINPHPAKPWVGRGPLQLASADSETLGRIADSLRLESRAPVAHVIPLPHAAGADTALPDGTTRRGNASRIADALGSADGRTQLLEALGMGLRDDTANLRNEYQQHNFGPTVPVGSIDLRDRTSLLVLQAFGVSPGLLTGEATAMIQARKGLYLDVLRPWANAITEALSITLNTNVSLDFSRSQFYDIQRMSRAVATLLGVEDLSVESIEKIIGVDLDVVRGPEDVQAQQAQRIAQLEQQLRDSSSSSSAFDQRYGSHAQANGAIEHR